MTCLKNAHLIVSTLVLLSLFLQGCLMMASEAEGGFGVVFLGFLILSLGWYLAKHTNLEQWAMKLLGAGAVFFLLG